MNFIELLKNSFVDSSVEIRENTSIGQFVSIYENVKIGKNVRIEDGAKIFKNCEIGDNSLIGSNAVLRPSTKIGKHSIFGTCSVSEGFNEIGDYTTIHAQCHITQGVTIGNYCFMAPFFIASNTVNITSGKHGTGKKEKFIKKPTVISDYVRIGICVSMTPGNKIGEHSIIYQNCLITHNIPSYSIVKAGKDQVGRIIGKHASK